jgi:multicomponent Na+:H+ antiporter subunit B
VVAKARAGAGAPEAERSALDEHLESRQRQEAIDAEPSHRLGVGLILVGGTAVCLALAALNLPRETAALPAIARYATEIAMPKWHTLEPVNEVVYGSRGFDTFGETFLLLGAIVGIGMVCRRKEPRQGFIGEEVSGRQEQEAIRPDGGPTPTETEASAGDDEARGGAPEGPQTPDAEPVGTWGPERAEAMTVVVRAAVRVALPLLLVAGIYLAAWGYSPGGGFPAGAVLLGGVLLVYVAYGYPRIKRVVRPDVVEPLELAGALGIVVIELLGLLLKGSFSANFTPLWPMETIQGGGILQLFSGAELVEVGTGLLLAVFGLLGMAHDWSPTPGQARRRAKEEQGDNR